MRQPRLALRAASFVSVHAQDGSLLRVSGRPNSTCVWTSHSWHQSITVRRALQILKRLSLDTTGPTAVEYAVMLALVVALCLPTVYVLGANATRNFFMLARSLRSGS